MAICLRITIGLKFVPMLGCKMNTIPYESWTGTIKLPKSLFSRMWRCLVQRRKKWRLAKASSKLLCYAVNSGDEELAKIMSPIHDRFWKELYEEENES